MCAVVLGTGGLKCYLGVRTGWLQLVCGMDGESQASGRQK